MAAQRIDKIRFEKVHGPVPKGYHLHRVIPGYLGGTYAVENLIALSPQEHALTHLMCHRLYGDKRDLTAYHCILEKRGVTHFERAQLGGLTSGNFQNSEFQRQQGIKGGSKGLGDHVDMVEYSKSRIAGGKASAEKHAKQGTGSFSRMACPFCSKVVRLVDLSRWHKKCAGPVKSNDLD